MLLLFALFHLQAQVTYSIKGKVKSAKDGNLPGATVFLDGTEKRTYTADNGEFTLGQLSPGTYQLIVHFVGYNVLKQNVIILDKSVDLKLELSHSVETLNEVVISASESNKYLGTFLRNFLGYTENGRSCKVLNPEILKFSEKGAFITAKTSDFLEIVNENLGYRIKYLLRDFRLNRITGVTSFTGECVFEDLKGNETEHLTWSDRRKSAYSGSFLHFARSFYHNSTEAEGFICRFILDQNMLTQRLSKKVDMEKLAIRKKKNLAMLKFILPLYVQYGPLAKDGFLESEVEAEANKSLKEGRGSLIVPFLESALIDAKGSLVDYRSFLIKLYWGTKRLGDQLPYEYMPVKS